MRILYIVDTIGMGGGKERQLVSLLKEIDKNTEITPYIIILSDHVSYSDFTSLKVEFINLKKKGFLDFKLFYDLIKIVRSFNPDIIHSWEWYSTLAILPAKILNRVRLINGSIRNAIPCVIFSKLWIYSKLLFPFSDKVVANSQAGLKALGKIQNNKYRVIYNGFEIGRVRNLKNSNDGILRNIKDSIKIGMVARFYPQKDYFTLISAADILLNEGCNLFLIMIGGGDKLEETKKFVEKFTENKDRYIFLGLRGNVEEIINMLDICVLSTNVRIHREGISNSIMEYMACKKPVVATKSGGNIELVEDNVTGFLVEPFNSQEMAEKIKILIENKHLRDEFGERGYEKIKNKFSEINMYENYLNLYKEVLDQ